MTTTGQPPKAFISHASEDKDRFVLAFAEQLQRKGVLVWLDKWEMAGGDSLPDRVFEHGIGQSDAVISVLSHVAMSKPWVKAEFDVSVVRQIAGTTRLIPIALDEGVDIPVAIQHLLRYDVPKLGFDHVVDEVVRDLFNVSRRPPLGQPPAYVSSIPNVRQLDDPIDTTVFAALVEHFRGLDSPDWQTFSNSIGDAVAPMGISYEQVLESLEILDSQHLVDATRMAGGMRWILNGIPDHVWLEEESRSGVDLSALSRQMLADIVNNMNEGHPIDWYAYHGYHWRTVLAILREFQSKGYLTVHLTNQGPYLSHVTGLARRALREVK